MFRFLVSFVLVFALIYAQSEETLQLSPQYVSLETISTHLLPVLSSTAQVKYLSQENLLLIQDKPAFLAKAKILFELINQPPKEIGIYLIFLETSAPLAPTPQSREELDNLLKKNPPLFQSEAFLRTNAGETLQLESAPPSQERHFKYSFSPKTQGDLILLKTEMTFTPTPQNPLVFQNTLAFKPGEFRLLATLPQEFHRSSSWNTSFSLFVECDEVPRIYAPSPTTSYESSPTPRGETSTVTPTPMPDQQMPSVRLEGIIYQENNPKNSWIFLNINNSTQQLKAGMKFQGFEVLKIESTQVLLGYKGKQIKLFLE